MLNIKDVGDDLAADMTQQIASRIGAKMAADGVLHATRDAWRPSPARRDGSQS